MDQTISTSAKRLTLKNEKAKKRDRISTRSIQIGGLIIGLFMWTLLSIITPAVATLQSVAAGLIISGLLLLRILSQDTEIVTTDPKS